MIHTPITATIRRHGADGSAIEHQIDLSPRIGGAIDHQRVVTGNTVTHYAGIRGNSTDYRYRRQAGIHGKVEHR